MTGKIFNYILDRGFWVMWGIMGYKCYLMWSEL